MLLKRLQQFTVFVIVIVAMLATGCDNPQNKQIEQLRKENPFTNLVRTSPDTILIVTCRLFPLELPDHVDVTASNFWKQYGFTCDKISSKTTNRTDITHPFTNDQICLWHKNGLEIALAPLSKWQSFQDELIRLQAVQPQGTVRDVLLTNPTQAARFPAAWLGTSTSLFTTSPSGLLRGYTLNNGDCMFQIYCSPVEDLPPVKNMYIRIVPAFRSRLQGKNFYARQLKGLPPLESIINFDQLSINCTLPQGYFMCITRRADLKRPCNTGQTFLTCSTPEKNFQLLLLITPSARTARQIQKQKKPAISTNHTRPN